MNKEFFARKKDIDELQINKANASDVYTKEEVINKITEKVSEIVADAPEDFDTLKEMSDWINKHEGSAAAMNTAIQSKVDKEEGKSLISDLEIARLADVENYDDTKVKNDIAINRTTLGIQCKNLLKLSHPFGYKYTNAAGTATWTFNNDYSVSMVANSQISSGVAIPMSEVTLKKGTYLYSVEGYSTPNITHTQLYSLNADGSWTWLANLSAIENKITVTEETTYSFRAYRNSLVTVGVTETLYPMLRYADITDSTFEPYSDNVDTRLIKNKSDIAVNKTTLGYQCKNLLKNNAVTQTVNGVTFTVNDDKSVTLNGTSTAQADFYLRGAWGSTSEILQKNKYIASIGVSQSSTFNGVVMHCINNTTSIGSSSCNYPSLAVNSAITAVYISVSKGYTFSNYKLYPMIRYADIIDDTYEPYQPSVQEQTAYSISVSGKSTSAAISYNGVPTLICLTPNTADSTAGGLYMINSAGAVVKLIEKTSVVVATNTANNTFTITNNTTTVMDVCISRCWGR